MFVYEEYYKSIDEENMRFARYIYELEECIFDLEDEIDY